MSDAELLALDFTKVPITREQMSRRARLVQARPNPLAVPPLSDEQIVEIGRKVWLASPDLVVELEAITAAHEATGLDDLTPELEQRFINATNALTAFCEAEGYSRRTHRLGDAVRALCGLTHQHLISSIKA